eukprot:gene2992-5002_t
MVKTKTKAQKLSKLFTPTKDVDIDNIDDEYILSEKETESEEEVEVQPKKKRKLKEKLPLRSELDVKGYEGKSISRNDLYESKDGLDIFDEKDLKEIERVKTELEEFKEYKESKYQQDLEDDDEEDDDLLNEGEEIQNHLEEINKPNFIENIQNERRKEKQKAKSVYNQKIIYDNLLKLRILLQKPLQTVNRFPQKEIMKDFKKNETIKSELKESNQDLVEILNDLIDLKNEFSEEKELNSYQTLDKTWNEIEKNAEKHSKKRTDTLEQWNRKTKLSSGNITNKNFKTINTSLENQMSLILKDKDSLIKKSQKILFNESILGKKRTRDEEKEEAEEIDEEIYDDREFYQVLLRDLIEDIGSSLGSKENIQKAISRNMKKNNSFRRTKDRSIKYKVHQKMVGFMAPVENTRALDEEATQKLFKNMFGGIPTYYQNKIKNMD